ncbi:MAG: tRNA (guanine(46)-N(7))-methyltransferase TrmB [Phycisphaerae bacterium]
MDVLDAITLEPPGDGELVDPGRWFTSPGSLEIEIGCGKGGFLLSRARAAPEVRLLGIEWANKYYKYCADRMARWGLTNVRVMRTDASHFVKHHLPPCCVSVWHVYHPDPWPKKRHHKRRLMQADFVEAGLRATVPGGRWLIQSDHEEYFGLIRSLMASRRELREVAWEACGARPDPGWLGTNFEIKYARDGRAIHRAAYMVR